MCVGLSCRRRESTRSLLGWRWEVVTGKAREREESGGRKEWPEALHTRPRSSISCPAPCSEVLGGSCPRVLPAPLAGGAPSATVAAGNAGEVKAPRVDGHSVTAEDAANGSGGGRAHNGVLWEGAEDGAGQGHHHGGGLDDDGGVLALPDTGLIAAVGQRGWAAGLAAGHARVAAGHVSGPEVHLGERVVGSRKRGHVRSRTAPNRRGAKAPPGPAYAAQLKTQEPPQHSPSPSLHKTFSPLPSPMRSSSQPWARTAHIS